MIAVKEKKGKKLFFLITLFACFLEDSLLSLLMVLCHSRASLRGQKKEPFRGQFLIRIFSTKFTDTESYLYYYGYRYYSSTLGRWLTRDPVEGKNGNNLYSFVNNNPLNFIDILGLMGSLLQSNSAVINGYPIGRPWVDFPVYKVSDAGEVLVEREGLERIIGKYKRERVDWYVDFRVGTRQRVEVEIVGHTTQGELDNGPLFGFDIRYWGRPQNGLIEQSEKKSIACRKRVECHVRCKCGDILWEGCWHPKNERSQYLYGIVKYSSLAGQPYCQLYKSEVVRKDKLCTDIEAKKACRGYHE